MSAVAYHKIVVRLPVYFRLLIGLREEGHSSLRRRTIMLCGRVGAGRLGAYLGRNVLAICVNELCNMGSRYAAAGAD